MIAAIPTFGNRVSPRFDCAQAFLLVTLEQGEVMRREEIDASNWAPRDRVHRLTSLGVETVICGGIDRWSADSLLDAGIDLHGHVSGLVERALELLRRGELPTTAV